MAPRQQAPYRSQHLYAYSPSSWVLVHSISIEGSLGVVWPSACLHVLRLDLGRLHAWHGQAMLQAPLCAGAGGCEGHFALRLMVVLSACSAHRPLSKYINGSTANCAERAYLSRRLHIECPRLSLSESGLFVGVDRVNAIEPGQLRSCGQAKSGTRSQSVCPDCSPLDMPWSSLCPLRLRACSLMYCYIGAHFHQHESFQCCMVSSSLGTAPSLA